MHVEVDNAAGEVHRPRRSGSRITPSPVSRWRFACSLPAACGSPASTLLIQADARELSRARSNLVTNAIRHTPQNGHAQLTATAEADGVLMTVTDGCGGVPKLVWHRCSTRRFTAGFVALDFTGFRRRDLAR